MSVSSSQYVQATHFLRSRTGGALARTSCCPTASSPTMRRTAKRLWRSHAAWRVCITYNSGMCGAAFLPARRSGVGQGKGENSQGEAIKHVNWLIPKILQKCVNEKYNISYYNINYNINHNIIILSENKYGIYNRDYDHPILIIIIK